MLYSAVVVAIPPVFCLSVTFFVHPVASCCSWTIWLGFEKNGAEIVATILFFPGVGCYVQQGMKNHDFDQHPNLSAKLC